MPSTMPTTIQSDVFVNGSLQSVELIPSPSCVTNTHVAAGAAIDPLKCRQQRVLHYAQESATTAFSETRVIGRVQGATGNTISVKTGLIVACTGAATITIDCKVMTSSILTAVITLDSTDLIYDVASGTVANDVLVQDDIIEITITAAAAGGVLGKGVWVEVLIREDPQ